MLYSELEFSLVQPGLRDILINPLSDAVTR